MLFGFDTSVIDGAVNSIQPKFALDPVVFGFTLAIILIGCAIGVWFAGQLVDVCQLQPCSSWTAFRSGNLRPKVRNSQFPVGKTWRRRVYRLSDPERGVIK